MKFWFSDRISVLRDGNIVLSGNTSDFEPIDLIKAMIGNSDYNVSQNCNTKYDIGKVILSVHNLSSEVFKDISFDVRESETLGISLVIFSLSNLVSLASTETLLYESK